MGTFEKLGILVIVVIIVMIMAVAIYQWGGPESQLGLGPFTAEEKDPPLEVDYLRTGHEPAEGRPAAIPDTLRIPNGGNGGGAPPCPRLRDPHTTVAASPRSTWSRAATSCGWSS